jgi:hypothetical protein
MFAIVACSSYARTPRFPEISLWEGGDRLAPRKVEAVGGTSQRRILERMERKTSPRRRWLIILAVVVASVGVFYAAPVLGLEIDDGVSVPSITQARLPDGLVIDRSGTMCASGGCWLDVAIDEERSTPDAVAELMKADHTCSVVSALDLRRVCVDLDENHRGRLYVSYKRILNS